MKTKKIITAIAFLTMLFTSTIALSFANAGENHPEVDLVNLYPTQELSEDEINGIIFMREEEKLARDVYLELYDIWGERIFLNIANSEQKHTDIMGDLIEKYNLEDPIQTDIRGEFKNQDLANLYTDLVNQGKTSLTQALIVGATIEDLDIRDLLVEKSKTDNDDILAAYQNLEKGSRNHLRSFTSKITQNGATYQAQYINQTYYNQIITSEKEKGRLDQYGNVVETFNSTQNQNQNKNQFGHNQDNHSQRLQNQQAKALGNNQENGMGKQMGKGAGHNQGNMNAIHNDENYKNNPNSQNYKTQETTQQKEEVNFFWKLLAPFFSWFN